MSSGLNQIVSYEESMFFLWILKMKSDLRND